MNSYEAYRDIDIHKVEDVDKKSIKVFFKENSTINKPLSAKNGIFQNNGNFTLISTSFSYLPK